MHMYHGYASYDSEIQRHIVCHSPLASAVSNAVAEKMAKPCLEHLYELINTNQNISISTDKDLKWFLEIFAFGFTCDDNSIYQLCVNIYIEWLKVFENKSTSHSTIPSILYEKSDFYWSQMFWHFYHLFVIRDENPPDLLAKCIYTHKVLRHLQILISQNHLSDEIWHILLQLFLAIGNSVLSSPYRTIEDASAVMSHRLIPSIYQVFLVASGNVYIPPGLWRTFRDYARTWRHRPAVVYDWAQLNFVLTSTVVQKFWCPNSLALQYICTETDQADYVQKIIDSLSLDQLVLTWIRFLTILQDPIECGDASIFHRSPKYIEFLQKNSDLSIKDVVSIQELPRIFLNVTKAIGLFVDIWLGKEIDRYSLFTAKSSNSTMNNDSSSFSPSRPFTQSVRTNPQAAVPIGGTLKSNKSSADNRRVSTKKSASIPSGPSSNSIASPVNNATVSGPIRAEHPTTMTLRSERPSVNSLIHLYGPWIFDACLLQTKERSTRSSTVINAAEAHRLNSETEKTLELQNERFIDEALANSYATLCTIFSSCQCDEFIHSEYLSRFYYVLQQGLRFYQGDESRSQSIIEAIILHSSDLFRLNLPGINLLFPLFLDAIDPYLSNDFQYFITNHSAFRTNPNVAAIRERYTRIRFHSIQILMSIISLPYHYEHLNQFLFENYLEKSNDIQPTTRIFSHHRRKLFPMVLYALNKEQDPFNVQLLFGTIRLACSLIYHSEHYDPKASKDFASEYASRAVISICEKGTNDHQLFLAALDTLISFITDPICQLPISTWKNVLKRLCVFIDTQLHRSPRDHTREMHSTCVATYNTLMTLIIERPTLLEDQENLFLLCEVIELGISGEKAESGEKFVYKKDKEHRPASQRVAEAAEHLMCVLFEHKTTNSSSRSLTGACYHAEVTGDLLNEEAVLHLKNDICRNYLDESTFGNLIQSNSFKYFAMNGNTLFALNELPISVNNGMPAVILLCRGLFGKNVWTLNFRHNSINTRIQERSNTENGRNLSTSTSFSSKDHREKSPLIYAMKTEQVKSETSIPSLDSIVKRDEEKLNLFRTLKNRQTKIEEYAQIRRSTVDERLTSEEKPAECPKYFEGIRLFLSHYGFCSLDSMDHLINENNDFKTFPSLQPRIQPLDSNKSTFLNDIKSLDQISPTLFCTGQIFYFKRNQHQLNESLTNMNHPELLNPAFLTMISKFGSVAEISRHCGWTGNVETSWKPVSANHCDTGAKAKTLAQIDGIDSILYWVDLTTEIAFYLPHQFNIDSTNNEMKILIVWFEEYLENLDLILDNSMKNRDVSIIGIHPLKNHLFRISLNSNAQRMNSVCASIPLINGMVLPLHILPFFLRQAVQNLNRRKRLEDSKNSQTAYSLRKSHISKIINKYQNRTKNLDEFFQQIFFSSTTVKQQRSNLNSNSRTTRSQSIITVQS